MLNLLMVDDEARTLNAIDLNMDWEACGIGNVFKASCVEDALLECNDKRVDLLLCDIEMPGGSGLDLLAKIREGGHEVPCIFLTCHAEFDYLQQAIRLNSTDYILKPVDYAELQAALAKAAQRVLGSGAMAEGLGMDAPGQDMPEKGRNIEKEVKQYIRDHMVEPIATGDIAAALHFNSKYLARAFKKSTGLTVSDYITRERIREAQKLLSETNFSIKVVGELVGYTDNAYFSRIFKTETGYSPSEYRDEKGTW